MESTLKSNRQVGDERSKIFGIGLSRTGTKSLTIALNMLGFNVVHYPQDELTFVELINGKYELSLLENVDGITDITVSPFFAQLDKLYPKSKFILTVREKELWLKGLERHMSSKLVLSNHEKNKMNFSFGSLHFTCTDKHEKQSELRRFLRAATYGVYSFDRERMSYVYDMHYKNVINYFEDRPESLLIMDITAGEGWTKLCPFFDLPVLDEPFPHRKIDI